ncbi:MAG: Protein-L-isoaspartate O-methyltransferase [Candidatus Bathyarchaeota archaeon BA1]|nr:MAG: Protein-L-isoaspartate O-methyltransferase [Candidatus Bathyarchaeota archaeon BA1]
MLGWVVPPPRKPIKSKEELLREREEKVRWLIEQGFLRSRRIMMAMLRVPREDFIPDMYRDHAYLEVPLPLPGQNATISCPHSYPLFYEALDLREGDRLLEVGTGSGYGAALAKEVVGSNGKVVTVEIDEDTYKFAKLNLEKLGYKDVLLILGDGSLGYPAQSPYDKICITAACPRIPDPLIHQLKTGGKLIAPVGHPGLAQDLALLEKCRGGTLTTNMVEKVLYVPLRGRYGWLERP